jgi:hypothetical protein
MHIKNPFKNLQTYTSAIKGLKQSATDWYHSQIKKLSDSSFRSNPTYEKLEKRNKKVGTVVPGRMYMFSYDPKYKDTLPLYDKFPLVFPFALTDNGFIGLNVHYLQGNARMVLMGSLVNIYIMYPKRVDRLSWEFLKNYNFFPGSKDCIHRYLWSHVRSPFLEIEQEDWIIASQLPVEKFVYNR